MKYLKKYKLFESVNEQEIHDLCKKYSIIFYTINSDGSIDVDGDVNLDNKGLTKLPVKFRRVSGDFYCSINNLTSLEGAPSSLGGTFYCHNNNLTSLVGAPSQVGNFYCYNNNLTNLEGAPTSVGGNFWCSDNNLTSLKGAPNGVGGSFDCRYNKLTSLEEAPRSVSGDFICNHNQITSLEGLEWKSFNRIDLRNNPVFEIIKDWINNKDRIDLIEYFIDMNVIQDTKTDKPKLILPRLEAFHEEMDIKMDIDLEEVIKNYEIINT